MGTASTSDYGGWVARKKLQGTILQRCKFQDHEVITAGVVSTVLLATMAAGERKSPETVVDDIKAAMGAYVTVPQ